MYRGFIDACIDDIYDDFTQSILIDFTLGIPRSEIWRIGKAVQALAQLPWRGRPWPHTWTGRDLSAPRTCRSPHDEAGAGLELGDTFRKKFHGCGVFGGCVAEIFPAEKTQQVRVAWSNGEETFMTIAAVRKAMDHPPSEKRPSAPCSATTPHCAAASSPRNSGGKASAQSAAL